ncbi:MAG TPA: pitrilysin family protein [Bacteroidia bacterium]|jgi:predicted Zn-dependent peptidase|nr:pitrilysin family protein [Bacteroidia bacterium]
MINFEKFQLSNGLRVIVHQDKSTPIACLNILYDVGARDENPEQTGFAHLFEHLMFGGSINIDSYDEPLQMVGGENNAFTTNDITNYYLTLPVENLETGFWLESDRMLSLAFSDKSLEVQRNVVIEEFKQRYLNQPYGDVWLLLRPMAYKVHSYRWDTIGKEISHIENAQMQDVKNFFKKYYCPNNAIMVVAGNVKVEDVKQLAEKWFGPIPQGPENKRNIPKEPEQTEERTLTVERNVPVDAIYKAYHMCARRDKAYYAIDLISDVLSQGNSSRLHKSLIKEKKLFSDIHAYVMGELDEGLFVVSGKLIDGVTMEQADAAINEELEKMKTTLVATEELTKVKNKTEATHIFGEVEVLNKATNLAISELLGSADLINEEVDKYLKVTAEEMRQQAIKLFRKENCSTLYYKAKK